MTSFFRFIPILLFSFLVSPLYAAAEANISSKSENFNRLSGIDLFGDDLNLEGIKGLSLTECENICLSDNSCRAYSFIKEKQWCFPKHDVGNPRENPKVVSGVRVDLNLSFDCSEAKPDVVRLPREYTCLYEQDIGLDPYRQWWNVVHLLPTASWNYGGGDITVFVHGDGKLGDFFGTLEINCQRKSANWITAAGFVSVNEVPTEIYRRLGFAYCDTDVTLRSLNVLWE